MSHAFIYIFSEDYGSGIPLSLGEFGLIDAFSVEFTFR